MSRVEVLKSVRRAGVAALAAALLASCGGAERVEPFVPTRIIAFGDEQSLLQTPNQGKYSINNEINSTTPQINCALFPLWIQQLAVAFNLTFQECPPAGVTNAPGRVRAQANATVDMVRVQLDTYFQTGTFGPQDLVTVFVGLHDILDVYSRVASTPAQQLLSEAKARGQQLGEQINRIARVDGRVLFVTVQDVGLSPFGRGEDAAHPSAGRAAFLTELTRQFNLGAKISVIGDGRLIGLVDWGNASQIIGANPAANGFADVSRAACTAALPTCDTTTLITGANAQTFFWADGTRLSPGAHNVLAQQAVVRAKGNPF